MTQVNERVLAIRNTSREEGRAYVFGEGVYLGDLIPDGVGWPRFVPNPCIRLDDGTLVWGFQCWWGPVERAKASIAGLEVVSVPVREQYEILASP